MSAPLPASLPAALAVTGDLTIGTAAEWHRRFLAHLTESTAPAFDLSGVAAADVFGLQLLSALGRHPTAQGTPPLQNASPALRAAAAAAGFNPTTLFQP